MAALTVSNYASPDNALVNIVQNKSRTMMKIQIMLSTWDNGNSLIIEIVNNMSVDTT